MLRKESIAENGSIEEMKPYYIDFWEECMRAKLSKKLMLRLDACFSKHEKKTQILPEELIERIDLYLGDDVGTSEE